MAKHHQLAVAGWYRQRRTYSPKRRLVARSYSKSSMVESGTWCSKRNRAPRTASQTPANAGYPTPPGYQRDSHPARCPQAPGGADCQMLPVSAVHIIRESNSCFHTSAILHAFSTETLPTTRVQSFRERSIPAGGRQSRDVHFDLQADRAIAILRWRDISMPHSHPARQPSVAMRTENV